MTFDEAKNKALNPEAFSPGDRWMVKSNTTHRPVEGAWSETAALKAADILNEYEKRNGRPAVYVVEALE
jgi:hypothetical protein